MPAASFLEASNADPIPPGVRQWAIEPKQCRWILAGEDAGAEALMCGAPSARHRPFCAEHCAQAYVPRVAEEGEAKESDEEATTEHDPKRKEAE